MKILYVFILVMGFSGVVNSASITSLQLTGGTYSVNGGPVSEVVVGAHANMTIGGYDGIAPQSADFFPTSVATTTAFCGCPMAIITSPYDDVNSPPFRPVIGDITDNKLTLDLDSWSTWRNGELLNQGTNEVCASGPIGMQCSSGAAETTYDAATGLFTADWVSVGAWGPFMGALNYWHIEGVVSAVPVPAAIWLFGSGLLGLAGMMRLRKISQV